MKLRTSRGMALIVTLAILVLVTIVAVGLATIMRLERATARNNFESLQARALAEMAADHATGLIRDATGTGSQRGKFWSSQPGRITVFNSDGTIDTAATRDLYSVSTNGTVNLNEASFGGKNPIATAASVGSGSAPAITASWINVLADPSAPASASNKIVGRYAFWVDDETAKINVNTADGSMKYSGSWYGSGTPADVNLQALKIGGANLAQAQAQDIARQSGMIYSATAAPRPFNSAREIGGVAGVDAALFEENNFNLTSYSLAPELNIFGEPKIPLMPTRAFRQGGVDRVQNLMLGDYSYKGVGNPGATPTGPILQQIYPVGKQLPRYAGTDKDLPQNFQYENSMGQQLLDETSPDYLLGERIARYLKGQNSRGENIRWPGFAGSGTGGFAGKYTDRQIDSIALQIMSLIKRGVLTDQYRASALPPVLLEGWNSGKIVEGLSRGPKLNEIVIQLSARQDPGKSYAMVNMKIFVEWYLPEEFIGYDFINPYDNESSRGFNYGRPKFRYFLNYQDAPGTTGTSKRIVNAQSPLGGFWMDNMLRIEDGNGQLAGVDMMGNDPKKPDPDLRAPTLHPWVTGTSGAANGTGPIDNETAPMLAMNRITDRDTANRWRVGEYLCSRNEFADYWYPTKEGVTQIELKGGLALWTHTASVSEITTIGYELDPVPLDSLKGPLHTEEPIDVEAVIPIPAGVRIPVPGAVTIHLQVADPLVNSMPGDWVGTIYEGVAWRDEFTMTPPNDSLPSRYMDGKNTIAEAAAGGDPRGAWWPQQGANLTKLQRFPSVGFLQSVRTGMMPDRATEALDLKLQKGVPYRVLNFSPSTAASQATGGGESYPDWAMLDLFTVPQGLQPLGGGNFSALSAGGATAGRVNPSSVVVPSGTVSRTTPLEAMFRGQKVSTAVSDNPSLVDVDEVALAAAIEEYAAQLGRPFLMAGEICNVPEIADLVYRGVNASARSRNDLVRQTVGNFSTQSNTFTVSAVGQTIKKKLSNTQNDRFESGDTIVGESRQQFLVERYLDLGADGVPGNAQSPGPDTIVGSHDDVIDPVYHPAMTYPLPYKYRVISAKEVR